MSDQAMGTDTQPMLSAGAMLRAARQAQGLHVAALATQLKISPRKLEALEADRFEELQGATFVRALAQAACRALHVDPAPVLARLPSMEMSTLEQVSGGLNAPFREHGTTRLSMEWLQASRTPLLVVAALLVGALVLWLAPPGFGLTGWIGSASDVPAAVSATPEASAAEAGAQALPLAADATSTGGAAAPAAAPLPNDSVAPAVASSIALQLLAREASWVEVTDAGGRSLIARTLAAGEAVGLDGEFPLRVKIGNAASTEVHLRGQLVDLAAATRDNIARLELK